MVSADEGGEARVCCYSEYIYSRSHFRRLSKFVVVTLTALSLFVPTLASLSEPASAEEIYLDNRCRPNQRLQQIDRLVVFYKSEFRANSKRYWLSAARYQDGAAILCISRPNFNQPKPLTELQNQFIANITRDLKNNGVFIVTVREGNGSNVPITVYRLDVSNPNKPVLRRQTKRSHSESYTSSRQHLNC